MFGTAGQWGYTSSCNIGQRKATWPANAPTTTQLKVMHSAFGETAARLHSVIWFTASRASSVFSSQRPHNPRLQATRPSRSLRSRCGRAPEPPRWVAPRHRDIHRERPEVKPSIKLPASFLFEGQLQHLVLLAGLLPGAFYMALPALNGSTWLGIPDTTWFSAAILVVTIHQITGWFVFRTQLIFSLFSRLFGKYDMAVWGSIFFPLFLLRPLLTLALGLADAGSLSSFRGLQVALGVILLAPVIYTGWSIEKYFGIPRALGGDHFRQHYREMPLVREGVFKYSTNAMYTFAFLLFWAIALLTGSRAALAVALFQHAYIWVHMYCTEDPDMRVIYGRQSQSIAS